MPAIPPGGVELFVALHADPGFTAVIDAFFTLPVPQEGDSEEKWFILTAPAQPGRYGLVVTVVGGNVPLIEQPLTIEVTDKATAPIGDPLLTVLPDTQPEPGSTLLLVTRHSPRAYDFHVGRGENYTPLTRPRRYTFDPTTRLRRLSRELSAMAAGGRISEMAVDMANKGIQLWNDFVPEDIGDYLTGLDIGTETLRVRAHGDGDLVPWEMLHPPVVTKDSPGFLASLASLFPTVRLPPMEGLRLTSRLRLDRAQFVVPGGNLEDAAEEAAAIRRILGIEDGQSPSIREKAKLLHVLRDGGFGMLHIASHNRHGGEAALEMDLKQRFEPESLNEFIVGGPAWAEDAPLVFLNACGTDQPHRTFTSFSTWAGKFFHAGAGAFVGSMWDIRSDSARVFAERFYEALVQERQSLAQAAYRARQRTRETTRDPTWLAYAVHGHHLATVVDQPPRP
jgi:hypothetical protein